MNDDDARGANEPTATVTERDIALALIMHVAAIFSESVDLTAVDLSASFLGEDRFVLGRRTLDSLDLVEVFTAVEDELGSELFDVEDIDEIASLDRIGHHLLRRADPARLQAYCRRWHSGEVSQ